MNLQLQLVKNSDYCIVQDGNLCEIKRIEHTDNDRHWRELKDVLVEVKARFPEETGIALLFSSNTSYNTMIQVMDNVRSTQLHHGVDRKSTRLNSSHVAISYAVFCLKKKKTK